MKRYLVPDVRGLPREYWVIFVGWIINRAGGFVAPFLALYLTGERHLPVQRVGLIISLYGLGMVGAGPVGGTLADRLGRRPALAIATFGGALFTLILGWTREPMAIAVVAAIMGFFEEMYRAPGMAAISDIVPPKDRPRAFGFIYWAANCGFAIATGSAGFLVKFGYSTLFIIDAVATIIFGVVFFALVPETKPERTETPSEIRHLFIPYQHGAFVAFALVSVLIGLVFNQFGSSLPMDLTSFGIPAATYGLLMSLNGVIIVFFQPAVTAFTATLNRGRVLAFGAFFVAVGIGLNGFAGSAVPMRALCVVIFTFGEIVMSGITPSVISDLAPTHLRGSYQGAHQLAWAAAALMGPAGGAALLAHAGSSGLWNACAALGFAGAAGYLLVVPARQVAATESAPSV